MEPPPAQAVYQWLQAKEQARVVVAFMSHLGACVEASVHAAGCLAGLLPCSQIQNFAADTYCSHIVLEPPPSPNASP